VVVEHLAEEPDGAADSNEKAEDEATGEKPDETQAAGEKPDETQKEATGAVEPDGKEEDGAHELAKSGRKEASGSQSGKKARGKTRAFLLVTLDPNVVARGGDALLALFLFRDPTGESDNTEKPQGSKGNSWQAGLEFEKHTKMSAVAGTMNHAALRKSRKDPIGAAGRKILSNGSGDVGEVAITTCCTSLIAGCVTFPVPGNPDLPGDLAPQLARIGGLLAAELHKTDPCIAGDLDCVKSIGLSGTGVLLTRSGTCAATLSVMELSGDSLLRIGAGGEGGRREQVEASTLGDVSSLSTLSIWYHPVNTLAELPFYGQSLAAGKELLQEAFNKLGRKVSLTSHQ
ncbi:unnamed protein product, partial [Cladocopium goreaui]